MRCLLALGILGLLTITNLGRGGLLQSKDPHMADVEPLGTVSFVENFEAHKRANVIVIGDGRTYLGLYVFDRFGNCVAKDDVAPSPGVRDDLAVEWYPPEVGPYTISVVNFGRSFNKFNIAIR